mmetsp:Transcript_13869/g.43958  ORF Transcript_13869/g.43958 Transcript_13869/m.43958 type:complete len:394 (+) Transcript_13869:187-1368(+)
MATVPPTVEEGPEYEQKLIDWVREQGTNASPSGDLESDYSKGLSGTKTDTIIENAYGTLMRGAEGIEGSNPFPVQGCVCEMVEGEHGVGCPGKWLRTLNKQGTCYMYIHTITHVITAKRPEGMPDPAEDERKRREAAELAKFPVCLLDDVEAFARTLAEEEGVVPLFLADAPGVYDAALANFKAIKCRHIDTRPFAHGAQRTGVKFADHVELLKQKLIGALLNGTLACLDLQDDLCDFDFMEKICKAPKYRDMFPEQVFNARTKGWRKDLLKGKVEKPGFAFTVMTTLGHKAYLGPFKNCLPMGSLKPVRLLLEPPVSSVDMRELVMAIDAAVARGKTPVLIDRSADGRVDTFLSYQRCQVVDVAQTLTSARTDEEKSEVLRAALVRCHPFSM